MAAPVAPSETWDRSVLERLIGCCGLDEPQIGAERLIREFGSVGAVLSSVGSRRFAHCSGDSRVDELMAAVGEFLSCVLRARMRERDVLSGRDAVLDYLRVQMAFCARETLRVLYLDAAHGLVADELASVGTVDSISFYAREIVGRALELGAVGLILAHNHPSGDPTATTGDVAATDALIRACAPLGIAVHDHLVVADRGIVSLRGRGLLA